MSSTTSATMTVESEPPFIANPGGKLDYVSFTVSHSHSDILAQICAEINYEILSGEPRLCRDVRAQVVQTPLGEYIAIANLHDNHKKYFDALFTDEKTPNAFFEALLVESGRGIASVAQQLTQNQRVTVYRSSDWLHA
ncbi:hypothetical protein CJU89_3889 [Yarrowia sp. B02]|nr:hypothetical protein CJU89_3889 [Yarrowia sp. B02]